MSLRSISFFVLALTLSASTARANKPAVPDGQTVATSRSAIEAFVTRTNRMQAALSSLRSNKLAVSLNQHRATQLRKGLAPDDFHPIATHGPFEFVISGSGLYAKDSRKPTERLHEVVPQNLFEVGIFTPDALHAMLHGSLMHAAGITTPDAKSLDVAVQTIATREADARALEQIIANPKSVPDIKLLHALCEACTLNRLPSPGIRLAANGEHSLEVVADAHENLGMVVKAANGTIAIRAGQLSLKDVVALGIETTQDLHNAVGNLLSNHAPEDFTTPPEHPAAGQP